MGNMMAEIAPGSDCDPTRCCSCGVGAAALFFWEEPAHGPVTGAPTVAALIGKMS
jgi:hypothetical protein